MAELDQLLKDAGLSEQEIKDTVAAFNTNPKVADAIRQGTMRKSDYSRKQDELRTEAERIKDDYQQKWNTANTEYQRMLHDYEASQTEIDDAKKKLNAAEEKLKNAPDPTKMITQEQIDAQVKRELTQFAGNSTAYFGDVMEILDEHRELFGKRISPKELIAKAAEAGKTPVDYWNETYKVEDKRREMAETSRKAEEDRIRKEERDKVILEMSSRPDTRPMVDSRSPFYEPKSDEAKQPWDNPSAPVAGEEQLMSELLRIGH